MKEHRNYDAIPLATYHRGDGQPAIVHAPIRNRPNIQGVDLKKYGISPSRGK